MTFVRDVVDLSFQYFAAFGQIMEGLPTFWIGTVGMLSLIAVLVRLQYGGVMGRLVLWARPSRLMLSLAVIVDAVRVAVGSVSRSSSLTGAYVPSVRARRLARIMHDGYIALPLSDVYEDTRDEKALRDDVALEKNRSTLVSGKPGAGKTNFIELLLEQIERGEDEPLVVFDYKRDYQQYLAEHDMEYIRLTPSGASRYWNVFQETEGTDLEDYLEVSKTIFSGQEQGKYWTVAAAQVMAGVLTLLDRELGSAGVMPTNRDLVEYLRTHEAEEIHNDLSRHENLASAAQHIPDNAADAQAAGVISNVQVALMEMFLADFAEEGEFSVREYMEDPDGVLVLDMPPERQETTAPVFGFLLDWCIRYSLQDDRQCTFVMDEFARLPELKQLDALVTQGRSYNAQAFAGVQSIAQVRETYGDDGAESLLSGFNQVVLMQPQSGDSATIEFSLDTVGAETVDKRVMTVDDGGSPAGSTTEQSEVYPVTRDDFVEFAPGECVVVRRDGSWVHGRVPLVDDVAEVLSGACGLV